jgi:hypothetical protein
MIYFFKRPHSKQLCSLTKSCGFGVYQSAYGRDRGFFLMPQGKKVFNQTNPPIFRHFYQMQRAYVGVKTSLTYESIFVSFYQIHNNFNSGLFFLVASKGNSLSHFLGQFLGQVYSRVITVIFSRFYANYTVVEYINCELHPAAWPKVLIFMYHALIRVDENTRRNIIYNCSGSYSWPSRSLAFFSSMATKNMTWSSPQRWCES